MTSKSQNTFNKLRLDLEPETHTDAVTDTSFQVFRLVAYIDGKPLQDGRLSTIDGRAVWLSLRYDLTTWLLTCTCGNPDCAGYRTPSKTHRTKRELCWVFPSEYFDYFVNVGLARGRARELTFRFQPEQIFEELERVIEVIRQYEKDSGSPSGFAVSTYRAPAIPLMEQLERVQAHYLEKTKSQRYRRHTGLTAGVCVGSKQSDSVSESRL